MSVITTNYYDANGNLQSMNVCDMGGGNSILLNDDTVVTSVMLGQSVNGQAAYGGGSMAFLSNVTATTTTAQAGAACVAGGGDFVRLNVNTQIHPTLVLAQDNEGSSVISGLEIGRDIFDIALTGGQYGIVNAAFNNCTYQTEITLGATGNCVLIGGLSAADTIKHSTVYMNGGIEHLKIQ